MATMMRRFAHRIWTQAFFERASLEELQFMLAELDLLGRKFGPNDLRIELARYLGIAIEPFFHYPDLSVPVLGGEVLRQGTLAEVCYDPDNVCAIVAVRQSLWYRPWPAWELNLHHEMSHLALDHQIRFVSGSSRGDYEFVPTAKRIVSRAHPNLSDAYELKRFREKVYEPEAHQWASWLVFAGNYPVLFQKERINQAT